MSDLENPLSHLSKADQELLLGSPLSPEESTLLKGILQGRGVLAERETEQEVNQKIDTTLVFLESYFSKYLPKDFFDSFRSLVANNTIVLKDKYLPEFVSEWTNSGDYVPEELLRSQSLATLGAQDPISQLVIFSDQFISEEVVAEEIIHSFLVSSQRYQTISIAQTSFAGIGNSYYSDPNEQITKYLVTQQIGLKLITWPSIFYRSAQMGAKRVDNLGWEAILKGEYSAEDESEYSVEPRGDDDGLDKKAEEVGRERIKRYDLYRQNRISLHVLRNKLQRQRQRSQEIEARKNLQK